MARYKVNKTTGALIPLDPTAGHEIINESGVAMTQRAKLKFLNSTVTDDATNDQTIIQPQGSSGGHTIENASGTAMTQRTGLQFTGDVSITDDSTNDRTVIDVSGGGHTIKDSSGTTMTQRDTLQFSGMNVIDDSTNNKTIVQGQIVKKTRDEYNALSSAEKSDPNITYFITDDETAFPARECASITISTSNWSNSTTTVDSVAYYIYEVSLSTVFDSHPDIYLVALSTFPTSAEKQAYMTVDYITVDSATNKLKCYARSKPSADFVIIVKGVSV